MFLTRAVSQVNLFPRQLLYDAHDQMSVIVLCKSVKIVQYRGLTFHYVNCVIRLQSGVNLIFVEKRELLKSISRRLFYISSSVKERLDPWIMRHGFTDFRFVISGLFIKHKKSAKLALSTMSFEVSSSTVPSFVPFLRYTSMLVRVSRWMVMTGICVTPSLNNKVIINEGVFYRSMLKTVCPSEYWPVLSQGLCYIVGVREYVTEVEHWIFHVHTPYESDIKTDCDPNCNNCTKSQPLTLQHISQLVVIAILFRKRRSMIDH